MPLQVPSTPTNRPWSINMRVTRAPNCKTPPRSTSSSASLRKIKSGPRSFQSIPAFNARGGAMHHR